jgi:hypothetical protein
MLREPTPGQHVLARWSQRNDRCTVVDAERRRRPAIDRGRHARRCRIRAARGRSAWGRNCSPAPGSLCPEDLRLLVGAVVCAVGALARTRRCRSPRCRRRCPRYWCTELSGDRGVVLGFPGRTITWEAANVRDANQAATARCEPVHSPSARRSRIEGSHGLDRWITERHALQGGRAAVTAEINPAVTEASGSVDIAPFSGRGLRGHVRLPVWNLFAHRRDVCSTRTFYARRAEDPSGRTATSQTRRCTDIINRESKSCSGVRSAAKKYLASKRA